MNLKQYLDQPDVTQEGLAKQVTTDTPHKTATKSAVGQWLKSQVPSDRVLQLERISDGLMSRHDLRPDLYPNESSQPAVAVNG